MRISRQTMAMMMARAASLRSTCPRLNVGAVLMGDNAIVATGYNGSPSGEPHCHEVGCLTREGSTGCYRTIHAEENVINYMEGQWKNDVQYCLYTTHSPCPQCFDKILDSRIRRVFYETEYRKADHLDISANHHIGIYQVMPSGIVLDIDGEIIEFHG